MNKFITVCTNSILTFHRMLCRIFIIMIIGTFSPVVRKLTSIIQNGTKRTSLHIFWYLHTGIIKESRCKVYVHTQSFTLTSCSNGAWITYKQRHTCFFIHETLVEPSVLSKEKSLVGGIYYYSIVKFTYTFQVFHQPPYTFIHRHSRSKIVTHVLLIFPTYQIAASEFTTTILLYTRRIYFVPFILHFLRHTFIHLVQAVGSIAQHFITCKKLQIPIISKGMFYAHILLLRCTTTSFVIIKESGRFRKYRIIEQSQMTRSRHPVAVRRFMMEHQTERLVLINTINIFYGLISYDIGNISFLDNMLSILIEIRVIVITLFLLPCKDTPVIKALRLENKMPFTNNACLITGLMKKTDKCRLVRVEPARIVSKTIYMAHLSGKDTGTARTGQCVSGITSVHAYSLMCQAVKIWSLNQIAAIT